MRTTKEYLSILRNEIHSTVMATVDSDGHPVTRAIDVMLADDTTFYFLTAKGKDFYNQLMKEKYIALTGMTGGEGMDISEASIHTKAVSVRGTIENIGTKKLDEIFEKNPYMASIYPDKKSREALEVFRMADGKGEFFDLSTKPITRDEFFVGKSAREGRRAQILPAFLITDKCIGCGACASVCPQNCIDVSRIPFVIDQTHCLHCGNCFSDCPVSAVVRGSALN